MGKLQKQITYFTWSCLERFGVWA